MHTSVFKDKTTLVTGVSSGIGREIAQKHMTPDSVSVLFEPFRVKSLELKNRIVMAPMTRSFAPDGIPGEPNALYYRRRAEAEVGLILSEGTIINRPASRFEPNIPVFHGDAALAGWKQVIDGVHAAGGKMGPQLWHTGGVKTPTLDWEPDIPVESVQRRLFFPTDDD